MTIGFTVPLEQGHIPDSVGAVCSLIKHAIFGNRSLDWGYCRAAPHVWENGDLWNGQARTAEPFDFAAWFATTRGARGVGRWDNWTREEEYDTVIARFRRDVQHWQLRAPLVDIDGEVEDLDDHEFVTAETYPSGEELNLLALLRHLVGASIALDEVLDIAAIPADSGGGAAGNTPSPPTPPLCEAEAASSLPPPPPPALAYLACSSRCSSS